MHRSIPTLPPMPSHAALAGAAMLVELLSACAFVLAAVWTIRTSSASSHVLTWLGVGFAGLLAGAMAHRGSVGGLVVSAGLAAALAVTSLVRPEPLVDMLRVAGVVPFVTADAAHVATGVGLGALAVVLACACLLPQARRFAAWQRLQIARAFAIGNVSAR